MKFMIGKSYRQTLPNNQYLDISIFPNEWTTTINMSLWEEGNAVAISFVDKTYFNIDKILPLETAKRISKYLVNKQSQKVAGFNLIEDI